MVDRNHTGSVTGTSNPDLWGGRREIPTSLRNTPEKLAMRQGQMSYEAIYVFGDVDNNPEGADRIDIPIQLLNKLQRWIIDLRDFSQERRFGMLCEWNEGVRLLSAVYGRSDPMAGMPGFTFAHDRRIGYLSLVPEGMAKPSKGSTVSVAKGFLYKTTFRESIFPRGQAKG